MKNLRTLVRRKPGLFVGLPVIFVVGVATGILLGSWLAERSQPKVQVALEKPEPAEPKVEVRIYRPPASRMPAVTVQPQPESRVPEVTSGTNSAANKAAELEFAPIAALGQNQKSQPNPTADAKQLWLANAVSSDADLAKPLIAVVLDDLGIDQKRTRHAIQLPSPLTLSFIPYGFNLKPLTADARANGHELLVHVNMEPIDRGVDPGPNALLTSLKPFELNRRLDWALSRFDGFTGINNHMGSRFTGWPEGMELVVSALKARGLLYLDSLTNQRSVGPALARAHKVPYATRDVFLDHDQSDAFLIKQLALTERIARRNGHAVVIGHPYDVTIKHLKVWLASVESRGFQLVPLSAIIRKKMAHS